MKLAAIDIGTNSIRLLIAEVFLDSDRRLTITPLERQMHITRLGKNLEKSGVIMKQTAEDTIRVLKEYKMLMNRIAVRNYRAVGTEALRIASNSEWFKSKLEKEAGFKLEIINWKEEAKLSFIGALRNEKVLDYCKKRDKVLVIDIGGGSTEIITGNASGEIFNVYSVGIGCVKLTEKFINSDNPKVSELDALNIFINRELELLFSKISEDLSSSNFCVIGLAGTITTLASIDLELKNYDRKKIHGHILKIENIYKIYDRLVSLNLSERKKITGLDPKRADIIIAGTLILIKIMEFTGAKELFVSESDILDGIVYSIFKFC